MCSNQTPARATAAIGKWKSRTETQLLLANFSPNTQSVLHYGGRGRTRPQGISKTSKGICGPEACVIYLYNLYFRMWKTIKSDRKPLIRVKAKNLWSVRGTVWENRGWGSGRGRGRIPLPPPPDSDSQIQNNQRQTLLNKRHIHCILVFSLPKCSTVALHTIRWVKCNITMSIPYLAKVF